MWKLPLITIAIGLLPWNETISQNNNSNLSGSKMEWNEVRNRVYPMLKQSVPTSDNTPTLQLKKSEKPVIDSFIAAIHIVYLIEFENNFTFINERQLLRWGINMDSLKTTAISNLDNLANDNAQLRSEKNFGMVILNGSLEASLMLSDKFWSNILDLLQYNELVIGIPARDVLLIANGESKEGIKKLSETIKKIYESGDHVITKWMFRRENNSWITFKYID
jgi:uncharacterized protein YtpQ (UPF0354 family)